MRGLSPRRWVFLATLALWAGAATLQSFAPLLSEMISVTISAENLSESAAAEIHPDEAHPGRQGICQHHPQGCPADCFCPKTGFVGGEDATDSEASVDSHLGESQWVECSEVRAHARPVWAVYLPVLSPVIFVTNAPEAFLPAAPTLPRTAASPPPAKIPIV